MGDDDDVPQELDDYMKESIDFSLGLPVSSNTLALKLRAYEDIHRRLRNQAVFLQSKLTQKDQLIERTRAESSLNAQAMKKFVEENQKLANECSNLVAESTKWEKECSLYHRDREALMDFGNEAHERAQIAESRVAQLEEELRSLSHQMDNHKCHHPPVTVDSPPTTECNLMEEEFLESALGTLLGGEYSSSAYAFLESNSENEACQRLMKMWNRLRPSTQKVLSIAAEAKILEQDKENLRANLHIAEEEVKVLAEENSTLDEENKRVLRQYQKERNYAESGGKSSAKSAKRKSSPKMNSPIEKMMDFNEMDSGRYPLSPLENKAPRLHNA